MNKVSKNERGFSAVEGLLVILILVVIGAVGYMVYHNDHKNKTAVVSNTAVKTSTKSVTANPYAGWNTYVLPKEKLTFHYPTTWTIEDNLTDSSNDGIRFTSKTDSSFEILVGAGQGVATSVNGGNCVQQSDPVTFVDQKAYLDFEGDSNTDVTPPSCSPASPTIKRVLLSNSSTTDSANDFFSTKNIPQPAPPTFSQIVVAIDYNGPAGTTNGNKTISQIEGDANYKDAKLVVASMSY